MAFTRANLQRVGPQNDNAPTIWAYGSPDAGATVDTAGYFTSTTNANGAADLLKVGDLIWIAGPTHTGALVMVISNTRDLTASPPVYGAVDVSSTLASLAAFAVNSD